MIFILKHTAFICNSQADVVVFLFICKIFERILFIWAIRHPASGYVQGINDLVTPFFVVFVFEYIGKSHLLLLLQMLFMKVLLFTARLVSFRKAAGISLEVTKNVGSLVALWLLDFVAAGLQLCAPLFPSLSLSFPSKLHFNPSVCMSFSS